MARAPKVLHKPSFRDVLAENRRAVKGLEAMYGDIRKAKGMPEIGEYVMPPKRERAPNKPKVGLSELQHQIRVVSWWDANCHLYKLPHYALFAIPNGGGRASYEGRHLQMSGLRPGIEDLLLPVANDEWFGLFIEMKKPNGHHDEAQIEIAKFHQSQNYQSVVAWNYEEGIGAIQSYLTPAR